MGERFGDTVTVDDSGRITLPKEVREKLHLDEGDDLNIEFVEHEIRLRPERPPFEPVTSGTDGWGDETFLDASEAMVGDL